MNETVLTPKEWKREERLHHDQMADRYDLWAQDANEKKKRIGALLPKLERFYEAASVITLLDAGCGPGNEAIEFCRASRVVVAMDISFNMLSICRKKARLAGVEERIWLVVGDVESIPFREGVFDFVNVTGILHHTPVVDQALNELVRCLSPGGQIKVEEPNTVRCVIVDLLVKVVEKVIKVVFGRRPEPLEKDEVGTPRERAISGRSLSRFLKKKNISIRIYYHTHYPYSSQIMGERWGGAVSSVANFINNIFKKGELFFILGIKTKD